MPNIDVWNILVASDKMSDKMAYDIVKTLFEKKPELVAVHKEAENIDLKNQTIALADAVPSGREEIFRGTRHQDSMSGARGRAARRRRPTTAPTPSSRTMSGFARPRTFIEEEEGATSRFRGWLGDVHDGAARRDVAVPPLRGASRSCPRRCCGRCTSASCCCSCSCCSRSRARYRNRLMWWDVVCAAARRRDDRLPAARRRRLLGPQHAADRRRRHLRRRVRAAGARGVPPHVGLDHARSSIALFLAYAFAGPVAAGPVGAPRLRRVEPDRLHVPDARRHLRHGGRRLVVADHPVHDLRRVPAAIGRRQVLPRLELRRDGRQARGRGPHRGAGVVPARRAVGIGCRDDGDDRLGRVSDARARRLRQGRRRADCSPPADSARSSRRRCSAPPRS